MAEAVGNRPSVKADLTDYAEKLKKPLREFGKEVTGLPATPAFRSKGAKVVAAEFKKLSPVFKSLGLDLVLQTIHGPGRRKISSPHAAAGDGVLTDTPPGFDPVQAGVKLADQMKQAEGGSFTGGELKALYDLSAATLHSRRGKHGIIFWRDAKHDFHYPKWQFTGTGALLNGVQEVLRIFKSADEWRIMRYFLTPRQQLDGGTPLELLRKGKTTEVTAHARLHEEENSW